MDKNRNLEVELAKVESHLKVKQGTETILKLKKQKIRILLKLTQYESVINAGFLFIGSEGPDVFVFRHIVASYCHAKKFDEALDVIEKWNKNYKDESWKLKEMREIVLRIKCVSNGALQNTEVIDDMLEIQDKKQCENSSSRTGGLWRFRAPPAQSVTYFLCPRISEHVPCLFGKSCLAAHSREELMEWKARAKGVTARMEYYVKSVAPPTAQPPRQTLTQMNGKMDKRSTLWLPPPPNTPYLNQLIKNYAEDLHRTEFSSTLDGVKLTWSQNPQIRTTTGDLVWIVFIRSQRRDTLRTISLLHDCHRSNFRISEAYFCDTGNFTQPINLVESNICNHKNSAKLQVLSTFIPPKCLNRSYYYYRIGFTFHTLCPGMFVQAIVFDFKEKPKLVVELMVLVDDVSPPQSVNIPVSLPSPSSAATFAESVRCSSSLPSPKVKSSDEATTTSLVSSPRPVVSVTPSSSGTGPILASSRVIQRPGNCQTQNKPKESHENCHQYSQKIIGYERKQNEKTKSPLQHVISNTVQLPPRLPLPQFIQDLPEEDPDQYTFLPDHHFIGNLIEEMMNG